MSDARTSARASGRTPGSLRIALHVDGRRVRGSERQLLLLGAALIERGHELHVSCVAKSPVADAFGALGAAVSGARPRGDVDPFSLAGYVLWLRRVRPDAVLLSSWKRAATSALGARLAGAPRAVLRVGGPHAARGGAGDRLRVHALRHWIDALWVNSDALAQQLRAYAGGAPGGGVHVIANAVQLDTTPPYPLRTRLGLAGDARFVFTAAGLERNKGHDVLLAAVAALPGNVHLVVAGDGPERGALERQAAALGIGSRVHLLGHRDDVPALLGAVHVFALATRADSTPNAALEAMAAGLPSVITAVPGSAELLAHTSAEPLGWVVPIDDPTALADALTAALGNEGPVRGARARDRVRRERTGERLAAQVESLLRGMLAETTSPA